MIQKHSYIQRKPDRFNQKLNFSQTFISHGIKSVLSLVGLLLNSLLSIESSTEL